MFCHLCLFTWQLCFSRSSVMYNGSLCCDATVHLYLQWRLLKDCCAANSCLRSMVFSFIISLIYCYIILLISQVSVIRSLLMTKMANFLSPLSIWYGRKESMQLSVGSVLLLMLLVVRGHCCFSTSHRWLSQWQRLNHLKSRVARCVVHGNSLTGN